MIQSFTKPTRFTYAAVFDGHGGSSASRYCAQNLHNVLYQQKEFPENMGKAIQQSFNIVDKNYIKQEGSADIFNSAGTTANVLVLHNQSLIFANAGDSRAVCGMAAVPGCFAHPYTMQTLAKVTKQVTTDHKPHLPEERQRIEQYGSCVIESPDDCSRVAGMLAVSRAIGDAPFKGCGVIATPDVFTVDAKTVDFMVLACDGLWDVMSNEEVVFVVHAVLAAMRGQKLEVDGERLKAIHAAVEKFLESADLRDAASKQAEAALARVLGQQPCAQSDSYDVTVAYKEDKERYSPSSIARILAKAAVALGSEDNVSVVVGVAQRLYQ